MKPGLGDAYDERSGTFSILNQRNVSWVLRPPQGCRAEERLVLLVSSGPGQFRNREDWRARSGGRREVRTVFLVARPNPESEELQARLEEEHEKHGDILQPDLADGHRRLGYKILSGYVWSYLWCGEAARVAKTDDNVVLDLAGLVESSEEGVEKSVVCGSGTPHRNMKPLRSDRTHMTGNWSISRDQLHLDYHPDFCSGFLYVTSVQGKSLHVIQWRLTRNLF